MMETKIIVSYCIKKKVKESYSHMISDVSTHDGYIWFINLLINS